MALRITCYRRPDAGNLASLAPAVTASAARAAPRSAPPPAPHPALRTSHGFCIAPREGRDAARTAANVPANSPAAGPASSLANGPWGEGPRAACSLATVAGMFAWCVAPCAPRTSSASGPAGGAGRVARRVAPCIACTYYASRPARVVGLFASCIASGIPPCETPSESPCE